MSAIVGLDLPVVRLLEEYMAVRLPFAGEQTRRKFRRVARLLDEYLGRSAVCADFTERNVLGVLASLDGTPETINQQRAKLVALWNYAAKQRIVDRFPVIPKMPSPRKLPVAFSVDDFRRLLAAATQQTGSISGIEAALWWKTLLVLGWATGERRTALLSFRWGDYSETRKTLIARAESRKGRDRDRIYALPDWAVSLLALHPWPRGELIVPWDRNENAYFLAWNRLLKTAGLPADRYHKTHALRRSHASHLAAAGLDASSSLGHSSPLVTERHYLDPRIVGANALGTHMPMPDAG